MAVNIYSQVNWIMFTMLPPLIQYNMSFYTFTTVLFTTVLLASHLMVLEYKIVDQCFRNM